MRQLLCWFLGLSGFGFFSCSGGGSYIEVVDSNGQALSGAAVRIWEQVPPEASFLEKRTGKQGRVPVATLPEWTRGYIHRAVLITVHASGRAPGLIEWGEKPRQGARIVLDPGRVLKMRVEDRDGNPVPQVSIEILFWRGGNWLNESRVTDEEGSLCWEHFPPEPVVCRAWGPDGSERLFEVPAGISDCEVVMENASSFPGVVVSASSGDPIDGAVVEWIPVFFGHERDWSDASRMAASEGIFKLELPPAPQQPALDSTVMEGDWRVRFSAPGYRSVTAESLPDHIPWKVELESIE